MKTIKLGEPKIVAQDTEQPVLFGGYQGIYPPYAAGRPSPVQAQGKRQHQSYTSSTARRSGTPQRSPQGAITPCET